MLERADARRIIDAPEKKANEIGQPMNIAVAGEGANLIAHARTDGAWDRTHRSRSARLSPRSSIISTEELAENSEPGDPFFGNHASNNVRVMIFAGGIPLKGRSGAVVGAANVSGGSGGQDQAVAETAAAVRTC